MSLNIGEASAVNVLAKHLTGQPNAAGEAIGHDDAVQALAALADSANKTLHAGVRGVDVEANWKEPARA